LVPFIQVITLFTKVPLSVVLAEFPNSSTKTGPAARAGSMFVSHPAGVFVPLLL
jgi:hypothetical protein